MQEMHSYWMIWNRKWFYDVSLNHLMRLCVCVCVCVLSRPIHRCCHCYSEVGQPYRQKCVFQSQDDRPTPVLRASQQRCHRCWRLCQRVRFVKKNYFLCVLCATGKRTVKLTSLSLVYQQSAFTKRYRFRAGLSGTSRKKTKKNNGTLVQPRYLRHRNCKKKRT